MLPLIYMKRLFGNFNLNRFIKAVCALYFFISTFSFAQNRNIDSLLTLIPKQSSDSNKVKSLNKLTWEFFLQGNFPETEKYANEAVLVADKSNFLKGKAEAVNNLGNVNAQLANYPKAIEYYEASLAIKKQIGDKRGMAATYNNLGNVLRKQSRLDEAIQYHLKSLKIREELNNQQGIAQSYLNIGLIYLSQKEFDKALLNFNEALEILLKLGDNPNIGICYNNIGVVYYEVGKYQKAIETQMLAQKYRELVGDPFGLAQTYFNIALNHYLLKQIDSSEKYLGLALNLSKEVGDISNIAAIYNQSARIEMMKKNNAKAMFFAKEALTYSKKANDKALLRDSWAAKAAVDSAGKNWVEAYRSVLNYVAYRDSVASEESTRKILQTELQYEFDKKQTAAKQAQEQKDATVREEQRRKNIVLWSVGAGFVLLMVFAIFILKALRTTRKQNAIIEEQKNETELQKHLIEEKHREITDSINYAERIQRSFLATSDLLDANLKEYFVFFQPKDVVSGDFYWAAKLKNDHFILVTADSTGHGVPGAIMSILNISCLENAIKEGLMQPADILNNTRTNIIERLKKDGSEEGGKDGMDASLVDIDFLRRELTYAAANNPVIIVRGSEVMELKADKMPIGKHSGTAVPFTQYSVKLQEGDMIYTFTDGFPDQFGGPKGKKFKYVQFKQLLLEISQLPTSQQKEKLRNALSAWRGVLEQIDDICVVGIRIK